MTIAFERRVRSEIRKYENVFGNCRECCAFSLFLTWRTSNNEVIFWFAWKMKLGRRKLLLKIFTFIFAPTIAVFAKFFPHVTLKWYFMTCGMSFYGQLNNFFLIKTMSYILSTCLSADTRTLVIIRYSNHYKTMRQTLTFHENKIFHFSIFLFFS